MADQQHSGRDGFLDFVAEAEERARTELGPLGAGPAGAIGLLIRRVTKLMSVEAEHELQLDGLTWASFRVCFDLWVGGPQEPHRIAARTSMSRAAVSGAYKSLVASGYATTADSPTDQRSIVISLTDSGAELTAGIYRRHLEITEGWLSPLSTPEQQILLGLLGKVMTSPRGSAFGPGRAVNI
ncbi:hypothetical protein MUN77_16025 [Leucobacter allii]|uniref:MarR family winged helix-turn-helix transcriptional regulator n=1 Tax=Leucobacter allii TaxID=2932247 RepID=UPI001FD53AFD|nr:MarR family transcriptional regulator [Leucobacter allii]UOR01605.1 hypothetical protein MUN77_16025 [Leucobacter allii]